MKKREKKPKQEKTQDPITKPEIVGGVIDWDWVCGNCRSVIDYHTDPCPYCKWRINWHG